MGRGLCFRIFRGVHRLFFCGCCLLNLLALVYVVGTKDPHAFRLMPASPHAF
jgi:hypothetical protein